MRLVWRLRAARIGALLVALPLVLSSGNALAQSSLGAPQQRDRPVADRCCEPEPAADRPRGARWFSGPQHDPGAGGGATQCLRHWKSARPDHDAPRPLNGDPSGANGPYPRYEGVFGVRQYCCHPPGTVLGGQ